MERYGNFDRRGGAWKCRAILTISISLFHTVVVNMGVVVSDLRARRAADFGGLFREGVAVVGVLVVSFGRIVVLVGVAHHGRRRPGRRPRTDHGEVGGGRGSRHEGSVRVAEGLNLYR